MKWILGSLFVLIAFFGGAWLFAKNQLKKVCFRVKLVNFNPLTLLDLKLNESSPIDLQLFVLNLSNLKIDVSGVNFIVYSSGVEIIRSIEPFNLSVLPNERKGEIIKAEIVKNYQLVEAVDNYLQGNDFVVNYSAEINIFGLKFVKNGISSFNKNDSADDCKLNG